jgi:hypothetical protein
MFLDQYFLLYINFYFFIVIIIAPTIANNNIKDVIINHNGYTVYITLPMLVMWDHSVITPSQNLEVT